MGRPKASCGAAAAAVNRGRTNVDDRAVRPMIGQRRIAPSPDARACVMGGGMGDRRINGRWIAGALALACVGAFGAHATIASRDQAEAPAPILSDGYDAAVHFPGAALESAIADNAAPAPGTTGTMPLPDLPVPSDAVLMWSGKTTCNRSSATSMSRTLSRHCT
ncbi:MAG: hypothetical protein ACO1RT_01525 [Planctomycetaceae bacterium]